MSTAQQPTGWVGWIGFAAIILILNGAFSALQGLVALVGPNTYYRTTEEGLLMFDLTGWGWWNLIIGALLIVTGVALLSGATWARVVAVILAGLSALGQLFLVPAQPWWSVIVIGINVLVIYAITAHGREMAVANG
ncbi:hypothetical protein DCE93_04390 [Agromyces badenianii]|uniref:DUF7144 domain-containing protein n=1 Tax=Agromyces badenianii TaxID=2080742 RepID=A0A2S0WUT7_9MICO|nr:hypothetical protein [Agromyces badenianii]AWB94994.1 hypothetical protein DCE93_04390 [Agromyces badenianii]PWC03335.1 hypothetical protein DCE94_12290 [Agromyces badenianii]